MGGVGMHGAGGSGAAEAATRTGTGTGLRDLPRPSRSAPGGTEAPVSACPRAVRMGLARRGLVLPPSPSPPGNRQPCLGHAAGWSGERAGVG